MASNQDRPSAALTPQQWDQITENLQSLSRELHKTKDQPAEEPKGKVAAWAAG